MSFGSSPIDDVDRGPGEEAGDDGLGEELRDPAQPEDREQQEERAGDERDRRDELGRVACRRGRSTSTAPPATAASDELGPVEMWREVQKSA